jgi:autotransporter-associated beta strand protein
VTYTGTLTPNGTSYRLGGGGGTLTLSSPNALTGSGKSLSVGGKVALMAANDYDGGTVLLGGTVFPAGPVVLTLGSDGALGTGPLTFQAQPNASTVGSIRSSDSSARTLANPVVLNGGLNTAGTGDLNFTDTTPIDLTATRLFIINNPVTRFAQAFTGTGGITMDFTGPGTLVMAGNNSYTGATLVNGGTLVLTGDNTAATGTVTLSSRFGVPTGIVLGHDKALGGSTLTIGAVPATVAAQGTRTITNAVAANADFSFVGTDALTLGGLVTVNNNRIITNTNTTNPTTLVGGITGTNRTLTFAGDGSTVVSGAITTGTGTLTKNGNGTLTLQGANTYTGNTTVNAGTLTLAGGSLASAITVNNSAFLGFVPGMTTTSTKAVTLIAGSKVRIIGTPTAASYTLLTTTATITGTPELENPVAGYELLVEGGTTLILKATLPADYLTWAAKFPGADLSSPNADFDNDGLTNDQERCFGLDPTKGSSLNPVSVPLNPVSGTFSFTRRDPALSGLVYSVWTSTDLQAWAKDAGAVLTPGAVVDEIQTVAVQLSAGLLAAPQLFVQVRAVVPEPPPPLLWANFEANDGGFTVVTTGGTPWAYGAPNSPSQGGGAVTTGNSGSAKCWGTNLTGAYAAATDTSLRSPVIDLTGVAGASLSFARAIDAAAGHTLEVNVIDDTTDTVIASVVAPAQDADTTAASWQTVGPVAIPAAALGQAVRLEWRFKGLTGDGTYLGAYLDDVVVTRTTP